MNKYCLNQTKPTWFCSKITDEGSIPEMRIWFISLLKSDLKCCIHLSRRLFYIHSFLNFRLVMSADFDYQTSIGTSSFLSELRTYIIKYLKCIYMYTLLRFSIIRNAYRKGSYILCIRHFFKSKGQNGSLKFSYFEMRPGDV